MNALASRLLDFRNAAESTNDDEGNEGRATYVPVSLQTFRDAMEEAAAALSVRVPEGDMARALEWVREIGMRDAPFHVAAIEEAIAAYDPEHVGAFSGKLPGREAGVEVHVGADSVDLRWVSKEAKHSFNGRIGAHPLYTTPQLGGGWRPIAEAPAATPLLLWTDDGWRVGMRYDSGWCQFGADDELWVISPTQFQPLPAAPSAKAGES